MAPTWSVILRCVWTRMSGGAIYPRQTQPCGRKLCLDNCGQGTRSNLLSTAPWPDVSCWWLIAVWLLQSMLCRIVWEVSCLWLLCYTDCVRTRMLDCIICELKIASWEFCVGNSPLKPPQSAVRHWNCENIRPDAIHRLIGDGWLEICPCRDVVSWIKVFGTNRACVCVFVGGSRYICHYQNHCSSIILVIHQHF